jgi:hypothetical protein
MPVDTPQHTYVSYNLSLWRVLGNRCGRIIRVIEPDMSGEHERETPKESCKSPTQQEHAEIFIDIGNEGGRLTEIVRQTYNMIRKEGSKLWCTRRRDTIPSGTSRLPAVLALFIDNKWCIAPAGTKNG